MAQVSYFMLGKRKSSSVHNDAISRLFVLLGHASVPLRFPTPQCKGTGAYIVGFYSAACCG